MKDSIDTVLIFNSGNYNIVLSLGKNIFNDLNKFQDGQELGTFDIFIRNEVVSTDYQATGNINLLNSVGEGQEVQLWRNASWHMLYIKSLTIAEA